MRHLKFWLPCLVLLLVNIPSARAADCVAGAKPASQEMVFSHLGIYTAERKPDMHKVKGAPVWVSDFQKHPYHVEWLWVDSDRPAKDKKLPPPHVAYRVKSIEAAAKGMKVLTKPFCPGIFDIARVGFYESKDGATVEFMEFKDAGKNCCGGAADKAVFSHVGLITTEKKPDELFVEASRVWVTDFRKHPYHVEWLRFESDSPVTGPLRDQPHVAYAVDKIEDSAKGMKVLAEPFSPGVFGIDRVAFYQTDDGLVVELMEFKKK